MASTSWPNDTNSRQVSQTQYEQLVAGYSLDGWTGYSASAPAPVYADGASGMVVKVRAGSTAQGRGHGYSAGATDISVAVPANSSGSTRIDRLVLELDRSGTGEWNLTEKLVQGTAGSGLPPALTQQINDSGKFQVLGARITVPSGASAISAGNVFFEGQFVSPSGILICTKDSRPLDVLPAVQMLETDTNRIFVGTTSAWKPIIEDSGWISCTVENQYWSVSGIAPKIRRYNGRIEVNGGSLVRKTGIGTGVAARIFSWPAKLGFSGAPIKRAASYISGLGISDLAYYSVSDSSYPNWCLMQPGHTPMSKGDSIYVSDTDWIPATDDYWG